MVVDPTTGELLPSGPTVGPVPGTNPPPPTVGPPPSDTTIQGAYTTGSVLGQTISFLGTIFHDAEMLTQEAGNIDLGGMYHSLSQYAKHAPALLNSVETGLWQTITQLGPGTLFSEMLKFGFGVDTDKFDDNAKRGLKTVDMFFGFSWMLPLVVPAIGIVGKLFLANRWVDAALHPLAEIPKEIGLSWALGEQMSTVMEAAIGESVVEGIRRQARGSRLGWPEIRLLLRQHAISDETFLDLMRNQGFPEEQITMLKKLNQNQLSIGDLTSLWKYDKIDRGEFKKRLGTLGYVDQDIDDLTELYIDKAQSAAGTMLRSTARGLALEQLITLDQYREILQSTHVPDREWKDDIAAIRLQIEHGHVQTSLATLKNLYLRHSITPQEVRTNLQHMGYTHDAIAATITAWDAGPTPHPLTQTKILSYYVSHVLTPQQAHTRLLAAGTRPNDVGFLLKHAFDIPQVRTRHLTPALVTQAFLDGALGHDQLADAYTRAGVDAEVADYMIDSAVFRKSRQKRPAGATQPLTAAQIVDAWSFNLINPHDALEQLQALGYSSDHALMLLEIKNKGVINFGPAPPPAFANKASAEDFLRGLGYLIIPPPDPRIAEAQMILAQYGEYAVPPLPTAGPTEGLSSGGGLSDTPPPSPGLGGPTDGTSSSTGGTTAP